MLLRNDGLLAIFSFTVGCKEAYASPSIEPLCRESSFVLRYRPKISVNSSTVVTAGCTFSFESADGGKGTAFNFNELVIFKI